MRKHCYISKCVCVCVCVCYVYECVQEYGGGEGGLFACPITIKYEAEKGERTVLHSMDSCKHSKDEEKESNNKDREQNFLSRLVFGSRRNRT